ncbi:FAD-dependent oxidoreductase [Shouchella lonarensis]|uniref:NADPH-dependent 2,4-dienoyl-CoA reductase, sulfur reductase n=1 Tax=Shouchella lonarensis TaxID=1464122 RepID=A0A1G6GWD0_9BACI|nr:FAD-dependent oxidoreductase [Shouchella lonarensis]SDB86352.1 NADPH-dependent 2,4-dienoyl-CoA reductase, sulfur reductase [Shouchella lonarensis]
MKYVIIGGDAAGMSAAMQIFRHQQDAEITVLERGEHYSYAQCGLPYWIGGAISSIDKLIARDANTYRTKYRIDARTNHDVQSIDTVNKTVSGENFSIAFDRLLIASGASPIIPDWENTTLTGIHTLKTIDDAQKIAGALERKQQTITVIGAGAIGLEVAENLRKKQHGVILIQRSHQLVSDLSKDMNEQLYNKAQSEGIRVILNEQVTGFSGNEAHFVTTVHTNVQQIETDQVIIAVGIRPNTTFLENTCIALHRSGAVRVDPYMQTNIPHVYAAGDCATQFHRVSERATYFPLGTHANKQGRVAGLNMCGVHKSFSGIVGTQIYQFFDLVVGRSGLSTKELDDKAYDYQSVEATLPHIAPYYPGHKPISIRLHYDATTERILGGEFLGTAGVDKRVDVLATALHHGATMETIETLDLSYAPPFNTVWDPLQQTARRRK